MTIRMSLPLIVCLWVARRPSGLNDAGFAWYLIIAFLLGLLLETVMSVGQIKSLPLVNDLRAATMAHDPLDPASLIGHVKDSTYFLVPRVLTGATGEDGAAEPGHRGDPAVLYGAADPRAPGPVYRAAGSKGHSVHGAGSHRGAAACRPGDRDGSPTGRRAAGPRAFLERDRSHSVVHPRRSGPPGHRHARCGPFPALPVDDVLLRAVLQPAGHGALDGVAHRGDRRRRERWP